MSLKNEFRIGVAQRQLAFGQDCKSIVPFPGIDGTFLALAIKARATEVLSMVDEAGHGTGRLPTDLMLRMRIGVPPTAEQRRIAEILDTLDEQINVLRRITSKQESLNAALAAELIPAQTEPRRLGDNWELVSLADVVPSADYGISAPLAVEGHGIPTLRMNNLAGGRIRLDDIKVATVPVPERLLLRNRDVLFNRTNSIEHVGRTSIWQDELKTATFASYLVRLNPDQRRLLPEYLVRWLNLIPVQQRIRRFATPGVHQVNINPTSLRRTLIELPRDVTEQLKIVNRLDEYCQVVDRMRTRSAKLRLLKQGLIDDLLTAWVRVPVGDGGSE